MDASLCRPQVYPFWTEDATLYIYATTSRWGAPASQSTCRRDKHYDSDWMCGSQLQVDMSASQMVLLIHERKQGMASLHLQKGNHKTVMCHLHVYTWYICKYIHCIYTWYIYTWYIYIHGIYMTQVVHHEPFVDPKWKRCVLFIMGRDCDVTQHNTSWFESAAHMPRNLFCPTCSKLKHIMHFHNVPFLQKLQT